MIVRRTASAIRGGDDDDPVFCEYLVELGQMGLSDVVGRASGDAPTADPIECVGASPEARPYMSQNKSAIL